MPISAKVCENATFEQIVWNSAKIFSLIFFFFFLFLRLLLTVNQFQISNNPSNGVSSEAVIRRCSSQIFSKILQISQENTCAGVSFYLDNFSSLTKHSDKVFMNMEAKLSALKGYINCEILILNSKVDQLIESLKERITKIEKLASSCIEILQENIRFL